MIPRVSRQNEREERRRTGVCGGRGDGEGGGGGGGGGGVEDWKYKRWWKHDDTQTPSTGLRHPSFNRCNI